MMHFPQTLAALAASLSLFASAQAAEPIRLFNGKNLDGWVADFGDSDAKIDGTWSVKKGVLCCSGKPTGYIKTEKEYENYTLTLQWRWTDKGGNSGLLIHATEPGVLGVWPKSIEVQLLSGSAGDFWVIGTDIDVEDEAARVKDRRHLNLTDDSEKAPKEWNQMKVTCKGSEVTVWVNGDLVNHGTNATVSKGAIALQSEGTPIEFREVLLTPVE